MDKTKIRNFAIIAHVDHGKSTLADRFLEITNTVEKKDLQEQFLDQNPISRERGITIKLAPVRMKYNPKIPNSKYILNLIDTPGHVDFSYEVSRTLAACEGAILLVDATQGIQAQTVAHFHAAKKLSLTLIPVVNKIDLENAQVEAVTKELIEIFGFSEEEILYISAKTGQRVGNLLNTIIEKIPPPFGSKDKKLRALIFDATYDEYRGVVAYVRIIDGEVKRGDKIQMFQSNIEADVADLGYFTPFLKPSGELLTGEIGYIITGIKDIRLCRVGDTIMHAHAIVEPLPGYKTPKPMVFLGVYPKNTDDLISLRESLGRLSLNDTALTYTDEYSAYLGNGYRVGFLGLLHAEILKERLKQEFELDLLFTQTHVLYQKEENGKFQEPYMNLTVYSPVEYVGTIIKVCQKYKGKLQDISYLQTHAVLKYEMPYSMFIRGLSGELKSASSGFASIDYTLTDYKSADLVSLELRINDNPIDVLSELVYKDEALYIARQKAKKLKEVLPRQQFRQIIQSVVNGTIIAREEIPPFRKDVLSKMSGGDRSRKDKLLEKQKKGKSKLLYSSKVVLPQEALLSFVERSTR